MKSIILFLIDAYRSFMSPVLMQLFGKGCRFQPTCSQYAHEAVSRHGVIGGLKLSFARISKCHPFSEGGWDPVPRSTQLKAKSRKQHLFGLGL